MTEKAHSLLKTALCEFKKSKTVIVKGKTNPFHKSKYADIADILSAIEEELSNLGVVVTSNSFADNGAWVLRTRVEHKDSDEFMSSDFPLFGSKPQEFGSSITYARRYNMQSLLNLAAEDDDGNASNKAAPIKQPVNPLKETVAKIGTQLEAATTDEALKFIWDGFEKEIEEIKKASPDKAYPYLKDIYDKKMVMLTGSAE